MSEQETLQARFEHFSERVAALRDEVGRVVVGQQPVIDGVIACLLSGGHALLEGVPGIGKTLLVRVLAQAVDLQFARVQFTPDLQPKDIIGSVQIGRDEHGEERRFFEPGPIFTHVLLADEVNRATPRTQSALLEAMAERSVTVGRTTHTLEEPFFVLATQNPLEMDGTYPLPEAQLDRFQLKLHVGYPNLEELDAIMMRTLHGRQVEVRKVLDRPTLLELREIASQVSILPSVQRYALRMLQATHPGSPWAPEGIRRFVREGASPRGGQAILRTARVFALFRGEPVVSTADVRAAFVPALRHRLILSFEGEAEGIRPDSLLDAIVEKTSTTP
jgi:MoxR-like ATPase